MREIQKEIRRDRIENDNRKTELQSKAESGLKTANKPKESKDPARNNISHQPRTANKVPDTAYKQKSAVSESTQTVSKSPQITSAAPPKVGEHFNNPELDRKSRPADTIGYEGTESDVKHDVTQNKAESGIKTEVNSKELGSEKTNLKKINSEKISPVDFHLPQSTLTVRIDPQTEKKEIQNRIQRQIIEVKFNNNLLWSKAKGSNGGAKNKKTNSFSKTKSGVKANIINAFRVSVAVSATTISAAAKITQSAMPNGGDDLSSESASKVKETAGKATDKSLNSIKDFLRKKARSVKSSKTNPLNNRTNANGKKIKSSEKVSNILGTSGTVMKGVSSAAGAVQNFNSLQNSGDSDINSDLVKQTEEYTEKIINKGFEKVKDVKDKTSNAVRHYKNTKSNLHNNIGNAKNGKTLTNGGRTIKNSVKTVRGASRTIQKSAKTGIKTASKTAIKTGAKTATKTAKATAKITAEAAKTAAKLSVRVAQISAKAAAALAEAIGALMSNPVGWIILGVLVVVIIVIIIISSVSSSSVNTVSAVGGAVVSPLSWIFNDSTSPSPDIAEIYLENEEKGKAAMANARSYYKDEINGISFGERDSLELNGASFYPASSANEYIQTFFDELDYDDYIYLMELCYIKKLRDERIAQGLSENEFPKITLSTNDIEAFLINYCYDFNIEIIDGQICPSADCQEDEDIDYCFEDNNCPDVLEEGDVCPGHPYTYYYCDRSHIKAVVTISQLPRDLIENFILSLTEEEKTILDLGIQLINEVMEP